MNNNSACLCCFKNLKPIYLSIILLVANAIVVVFLIWGVADMVWTKKSARALYWVGFIILIITLILAIIILIFIIQRNQQNQESIRNIGKIMCIVIMSLVVIALILTLIGTILTIVDYGRFTDKINSYNSIFDDLDIDYKIHIHVPGKWWATAIVPEVITLIASVTIFLCARALYIVFNKNILTSISEGQTDTVKNIQENSITINQNQNPNDSSNKFNLPTNNINLTNNNVPSNNANKGLSVTPNNMVNNK